MGCSINHLAFGVARGSINPVWALCTICQAACHRRYAVVTSAEGEWSWRDACCTDVLLQRENKMRASCRVVSCRVTLSRRVIYFRRFGHMLPLRVKDPLSYVCVCVCVCVYVCIYIYIYIYIYTGLFKMIVVVLTTCHTQYT